MPLLRCIFAICAVLLLYTPASQAEVVYSSPQQLDVDYYNELIVEQPTELIEQLTPLISNDLPASPPQVELQARYLIASAYYYLSQRSAISEVAEPGLELAKAQQNWRYEARFNGILAVAALNEALFDTAVGFTQTSLELVETNAAGSALHGELLLLGAQVYYESGAIQNALRVMVRANDIFTNLKDDKNRSEALASIALMYDELGQPQQAIDYYHKSLALIDPEHNKVETSITYYNIALTYRSIEQPEKAREYALLSYRYAIEAGDLVGAAYAEYELASLQEDAGQLQIAYDQAQALLPVFIEHDITGMVILNHLLIARLGAQLDKTGWQQNLAAAKPLVANTPTLKRRIALARSQAQIFAHTGQYKQAVQAYKTWVELAAEQLTETQLQSTRRYQAMFELKEAEAENQLLLTQKKLAEAELEAKEFRQWVLLILAVLLVLVLAGVVIGLILQVKTKKKFKSLALLDELTQVRNRRSISVFAQKAITAARQQQHSLSFALIDIDHFKQFNDRYGHDVGDEVLKQVAQALSQELRTGDALGRWGGEEWLIVLPGSELSNMPAIFSRIQRRLQNIRLDNVAARGVSVSMGCTALDPTDQSLETVIKRADEALYKAKHQGRDQVEFSPALALNNIAV